MNILEQEDLVKGLPDQALFQQAENPSGQLPPFLVISEIQRRTDMRKRFEASEAQPQGTVADQIVMEGLGGAMPQQAPMSPPPGSMPPQGSMPPPAGFASSPSPSLSQMEGTLPLMGQGMAAGGILGFDTGGPTGSYPYTPDSPQYNPYADPASDVFGRPEPLGYTFGKVGDWVGNQNERSLKLRELIEKIKYEEGIPFSEAKVKANEILNREEEANLGGELLGDGSKVLNEIKGEQRGSIPAEFLRPPEYDVGNIGNINISDMTFGDDTFSVVDDNLLGAGPKTIVEDEPEGANLSTIQGILDRQIASDVGTTITEGEGLQTEVTEGKDSLTDLIDQFAKMRTGTEGRLDSRRSESQALIEEIRNEGRRDAFNAAMIQLGAGIAGNDMAGGLQRAGDVATSTNALARDAARAEQRGMRDYEEVALSGMDELGMKEAQFVYGEEKETRARGEALRKWEAEHGLTKLAQDNDLFFKQANLEMEGEKLKENIYIGREGLKNEVTKINNKLAENTELTKREAMRTFTNVLDSIQDYMDELPITTTAEEREVIRDTQQRRILTALRIELGEDFYQAFIADYEPTRGGAGGLEGEDLVNSILSDE